MSNSWVGFTNKEVNAIKLQKELVLAGFDEIKLLRLNQHKFLTVKENGKWANTEKNIMEKWFSQIREFGEEDYIVPMIVWLECTGLPLLRNRVNGSVGNLIIKRN